MAHKPLSGGQPEPYADRPHTIEPDVLPPASPAETVLVSKASDQHDAMISAFEAQEPALAIDLTLQHWDLSRDRIERFVRPDPLPLDVISMKDRRHAV